MKQKMVTSKINKLKREIDFAERKLVQNLTQIEGKNVLINLVDSFAPSSTLDSSALDVHINKLDNVQSLQPIVKKGKFLLSIYRKFLILKKIYRLFKKA